jgi:replicative DNA helicase
MNETIEKIPQSREAEQILLNCILLSPDGEVLDDVSSIVREEDFYHSENKDVYSCMKSLMAKSTPIDELSISEELKKAKKFDQLGGMPFVMGLSKYVETTVQAKTSALIVRENSNKRKLIKSSRLAMESIYDGAEVQDGIKILEDGMNSVASNDTEETKLANSAKGFIDKLTSIREGTYKPNTLSTGINHLDDLLHEGGIGEGEVFIIAAPTSCGKSQLALNIASRAAISDGMNVVIFSFEMPQDQVMKRIVQTSSAVNISQADKLPKAEREKAFKLVDEAVEDVSKSDIHVINYVRDMSDFRARCRQIHRKSKIDLLVVDYLQLIPWSKKLSKCDGIAEVSHAIKQVAMELNTRVLLLAQINRDGARSGNPDIHSLKDSGDIENDADVILMMYPENNDMFNSKGIDKNGKQYIKLNYKIVKNREGERDVGGRFIFLSDVGRFC